MKFATIFSNKDCLLEVRHSAITNIKENNNEFMV